MKPLGFANLLASAGGQYRAEGLASRAHLSIAAEKPFARKFLIGAGFDGYESLVPDTLYPRDRQQLTDRKHPLNPPESWRQAWPMKSIILLP